MVSVATLAQHFGRYFWVTVLASMAIAFGGCLEIEEKIVLKKNFSGKASYIVNLSGIKPILDMMKGLGGANSAKIDEKLNFKDMETGFRKQILDLKDVVGVSKAKFKADSENFIYTFSFNFKDLASLNNGLNSLRGKEAKGESYLLTADKSTLLRTFPEGMFAGLSKLGQSDGGDSTAAAAKSMAEGFLKSAKYSYDITFKRAIESAETGASEQSIQNKHIHVTVPFDQLMSEEGIVAHKIRLQ